MSDQNLAGWVPTRFVANQSNWDVQWCNVGSRRLVEPFFDETIESVLSATNRNDLQCQTPVNVLEQFAEKCPVAHPSGFIFHMSRCGSTLISQMFARLQQTVVISEAEILSQVLKLRPTVDPDSRPRWFRCVVHALGQARSGTEKHLIVKFDAPSGAFFPWIRQAFPTVPYVFVYREPVEVLISHRRQRSRQMLPAVLDPRWIGLDLASAVLMSPDEYTARVLAFICRAAAEHFEPEFGRMINYRELPDAALTWLPNHFGMTLNSCELETMRGASSAHAKRPKERFISDSAEKQNEADAALCSIADAILKPWYLQLESLNQSRR